MHLSTAWHHIRRSPYQSMTTILTITLTFFVASIFIVSALSLHQKLSELEKKPHITAFFSDVKSEEDIRALDERLKATGKVERTTYISKDEALRIYQEQNKDDPLLLEMVTADILPASLEISASSPEYLGEIAAILDQEAGIEEYIYLKDEIEVLVAWAKALRAEGIILVSLLAGVSLLVLLTVISMKIALRREEIEILKLLGATNWYIRWPFLIEGGLYGSIAGLLAWGASIARLLYFNPLVSVWGDIFTNPLASPSASFTLMVPLLGILLAGGFLLGVLGSFFALIRYL